MSQIHIQLSTGICSLQCDLNPTQKFKLTAKISCIGVMAPSSMKKRIGMLEHNYLWLVYSSLFLSNQNRLWIWSRCLRSQLKVRWIRIRIQHFERKRHRYYNCKVPSGKKSFLILVLARRADPDTDTYRNVQKVQLTHMILDAMLLLHMLGQQLQMAQAAWPKQHAAMLPAHKY